MCSEEQYLNQCLAEIAVLESFGLPKQEPNDDFTGESLLAPYRIRVLLHGTSGVPQRAKSGDLLVFCEIDVPEVRIYSVEQLAYDGSLETLIDKPGRVDLPTRIAEFLTTRSKEAA